MLIKITGNISEHKTSSLISFREIMKVSLHLEKTDLITFVMLFLKKQR